MFTSLEHLISGISALKLEHNEISRASAKLSLAYTGLHGPETLELSRTLLEFY